jgi:hypothetical protein
MKRTKHNLSHYHLTTADMGDLIPIGCVEALPGDTFQHRTNLLMRLSPMVAPVMHPVTVRVHHFFVPNRILWDGWEDFITGGPDGNNADIPPTVQVPTSENAYEDRPLLNYLGLARAANEAKEVNALPIYAYNRIYNEFYRDQDLIQERQANDMTIAKCAWEKDYFTTARPWTQKGDPVSLPIGDSAPVIGNGSTPRFGLGAEGSDERNLRGVQATNNVELAGGSLGSDHGLYWGNQTGLIADLSAATSNDINDIRRAFAIQRYQEARAAYGSRYTEYLRYLGVNPRDSRLQRPELLGGGRTQVNISEVLQTAPETADDPNTTTDYGVGDMYGHGIAAMRSNKYRRFIDEHGYIISLMSVRPKAMYEQGAERHWLRKDKEDYFQRELQYIGQQEVYDDELFIDGEQNTVFGYSDRYSEYRWQQSRVTGEFRDQLNYWHLARQFENQPVLNQSFIDCDPSKRIFNEQTQHSLWIMAQHKMVARRMVGKRSIGRIF